MAARRQSGAAQAEHLRLRCPDDAPLRGSWRRRASNPLPPEYIDEQEAFSDWKRTNWDTVHMNEAIAFIPRVEPSPNPVIRVAPLGQDTEPQEVPYNSRSRRRVRTLSATKVRASGRSDSLTRRATKESVAYSSLSNSGSNSTISTALPDEAFEVPGRPSTSTGSISGAPWKPAGASSDTPSSESSGGLGGVGSSAFLLVPSSMPRPHSAGTIAPAPALRIGSEDDVARRNEDVGIWFKAVQDSRSKARQPGKIEELLAAGRRRRGEAALAGNAPNHAAAARRTKSAPRIEAGVPAKPAAALEFVAVAAAGPVPPLPPTLLPLTPLAAPAPPPASAPVPKPKPLSHFENQLKNFCGFDPIKKEDCRGGEYGAASTVLKPAKTDGPGNLPMGIEVGVPGKDIVKDLRNSRNCCNTP